MTFQEWAIKQHVNTNHYYDKYLPYEFHLRMVAHVVKNPAFSNLIHNLTTKHGITFEHLQFACFGHDLIEDARTSYSDIKRSVFNITASHATSIIVADLIFAVTNNTGRDREERANDAYYEKINSTPGATFIKLCDRIANVQYGIMTGSKMVKMYEKEQQSFKEKLYTPEYKVMFDYLENLFETK